MGEIERQRYIRVLVENFERERSLLRPRSRWEDNIGMNHRGIGREEVDWIYVDSHRSHWTR
jgi:hypothetical protein